MRAVIQVGLHLSFVLRLYCVALSLSAFTINVPAANVFTRITTDPIVSAGHSSVAAWGDFNHDGFIDLIAAPFNAPNLLYTNNGNGTFTRVTTGAIATDSGSTFGCVWADYDNDGALDLFVAVNGGGSDWLYHNNGNGTFTKITSGSIVSSGGNGNNCVWGDYDNDGFVDLFVANSDQNDFLYHNNGNGSFTRITNNAIALKAGNSQGASWGDYDNDGLLDLFISRVNEPNLLYRNQGNGSFVAITNGALVNEPTASQGVSWGDYDNDGFLDLFVANPNARNFLYHNNGDGSFTKITNGAIATDIGNAHGCGWADYDNDGFLDMIVINRLGVSFLYHNNGDGTFTRVANGEALVTDVGEAFSGAWGDYNNDGFADLFVSYLQGANNNALYRNNGNSNNWLTITCEGRLSNRSAIGAKVRIRATINGKALWQMREISGGGGLGSQNDLRAGFGLGDATNAEVVRVEWPSGIVQQLTNVTARQFLTLVEPSAAIVPAAFYLPAGTNATFTLHTDLEPPLHWQWNLNGIALAGETNSELVITNVQREHAGAYTVSITNLVTGLSFTTRAATLGGPAVILQQPASQNIRVNSNVTFSLVATGFAPVLIQWQRDGTNLVGATNSTLTFTNVQIVNEGEFRAVVSNTYGATVSSNANLVALARPSFTAQPLSQSVVVGGSITFSASATGHPLPFTFRWLKNGVVVSNIVATGTNSFITITNIQLSVPPAQLSYRVAVTNLAGNVSSAAAIITVLPDLDGDGLPDDWEMEHGLDPSNPSDAALDSDGDGTTNLAEYHAGTDPNDPQSRLRLDSVRGPDADVIVLRWNALSNRTYRVETRGAVATGDWNSLAQVMARPTNGIVEIEISRETNMSANFYRLVTPNAAP